MKQFVLKLTAITLGLALIGGLVFSLFLPQYYLHILPFLLLFFYTVTLTIHAYQLNLIKKKPSKFTISNMLVTFLKLVLYSVVAITYIAFNPANALVFVICLMLFYLIFTFVEVAEISKVVRK